MDTKIVIVVPAALSAVLFGVLVWLVVYFLRRERQLMARIQSLLEDALAGDLKERYFDESPASFVENNLWRYVSSHEAKLKRLMEEKERVQEQISDISHQAVIPISNIVLYTQLLEEQADDAELKSELSAIREQAGTLDFLVEALVRLSRLESGIIHITAREQPLEPVLCAVRNQFQAIASKKEMELEVPDTDETAVFDLKWTIEALANIVDNAIKYTPYGGRIRIRVVPYTSLVRVDVEDDGIGIGQEEQAKVFLRFYRSEKVSDRPGVGIGLYLAREVMRSQNGYIKLSSETGMGSTFSLFFLKGEMSQK